MKPYLIAIALVLVTDTSLAHEAEPMWPNDQIEKKVREAQCKAAKKDLKEAEKKCSDAKSECDDSIKAAKKSCDKGCAETASTALTLCGKQDAAVLNSCRSVALDSQEYCSKGCAKPDNKTSECDSVESACDIKSEKQAEKEACK